MTQATSDALIEAELARRFGTCIALRRGRIAIAPGTVHALVGENGAGKSTLVKLLAGVLRGEGTLRIGGKAIDAASWDRTAARAAGIGIVQQHGSFAGTLSVVENAVLGVEPWLLSLDGQARALAELGTRVGLPIDPWARAGALSLGAAQRAEIVTALHHGAKLLILDEPTAVLAPVEVEGLLATLRRLAREGMTIVIVTHKLDEVRAVADEVTVLRAGQTVATFSARPSPSATSAFGEAALRAGAAETRAGNAPAALPAGFSARPSDDVAPSSPRLDVAAIARAMVGADLPPPTKLEAPAPDARGVLALGRVSVGTALRDMSLTVKAGELVGVAGVDGNGQRELALAIAGLAPHTGRVSLGGRDVTADPPARRLAAGLAHIPEDRHHGGLVLDATVADNLALGRRDVTGRFRIDRAAVARHAMARIGELDIRPADPDAVVRTLSGGNQQKVVVGRELSRPNLAAVVAAQPTRGVDLGAVARIHDRLRAAAAAGAGVLVISADLDELLALCHRVLVLLRGAIVGELAGDALVADGARAALGRMMTGAGAA